MGRKVDVDLLVGANEIAQRLGFRHPQTVHYYKNHDPAFPKPILAVGGGKISTQIWYWPEVERWARGAGRPSKLGRRRPEEPDTTA